MIVNEEEAKTKMTPFFISLLCTLGTLTAFACCNAAGRADDAEEIYNQTHSEEQHTK